MQTYISRSLEREFTFSLKRNPVTAILGPRQSGKSTLARHCLSGRNNVLVLDLDLPSDRRKLDEPELFLREHSDKLICIDEIQLKSDLFPLLRTIVDNDRRPGRFVILGSASQDIIRQSAETLAGRIHYLFLTPFLFPEIAAVRKFGSGGLTRLWWRGGFPPSFLAKSEKQSLEWRRDFIQTFLSRDIAGFGFHMPAQAMFRFWQMLSHYHGNVFNASKLGQALDITHVTARKYLDILEQTFMVRVLRPFEANLKKRLVKSPKVYIRDSGLLHSLLEIDNRPALFGHPVFGVSWEGWCIEQITIALPDWHAFFYRTSSGEEIDLVLERGNQRLVFEFKASSSPKLSKGFGDTLKTLRPQKAWVVCPIETKGYPVGEGARIVGMSEMLDYLSAINH